MEAGQARVGESHERVLPLFLVGMAAVFDYLVYRQWLVALLLVGAGFALVIVLRQSSILLTRLTPSSPATGRLLVSIALLVPPLVYYLARGRGVLSFGSALALLSSAFGLRLLLAVSESAFNHRLRAFYALRNRLLPRRNLRLVVGLGIPGVAFIAFAHSDELPTVGSNDAIAVALFTALLSTAFAYFTIREPCQAPGLLGAMPIRRAKYVFSLLTGVALAMVVGGIVYAV